MESLDSIKYFLVIFFYSTLFFSLLLYIMNNNQKSFYDIWKQAWSLNFTGEFDYEFSVDKNIAYGTVVAATILNVILMLNLLISILGDKYYYFMIDKKVYDFKEKIESAIEIQTTFFWKQNLNKRKFFYILTKAFDEGQDENFDDWQGKITFIEKKQEKRLEELTSKTQNLNEIIEQKIDVKISVIESKISGVEDNISAFNSKILLVQEKTSSIEEKIEKIEGKVEAKISGVEDKIENVEKKLEEILSILRIR